MGYGLNDIQSNIRIKLRSNLGRMIGAVSLLAGFMGVGCAVLHPNHPSHADNPQAKLDSSGNSVAGLTLRKPNSQSQSKSLKRKPAQLDEVHFLILGDTGTGHAGQYQVAAAMKQVCETEGCDFALLAGDNIYKQGVMGSEDPQFQQKFHDPYANLQFPFFLALGNHDQGDLGRGSGLYPGVGQFEIEHTSSKRNPKIADCDLGGQFERSGCRHWMMPDRYYSVKAPFNQLYLAGSGTDELLNAGSRSQSQSRVSDAQAVSPVVEIFVLDSNPLAPSGDPKRPRSQPVNQKDYEWYHSGGFEKQQSLWLAGRLKSSQARWKLVMTHHPYLNHGTHGSAGAFLRGAPAGSRKPQTGIALKEFVEAQVCGRTDLMLSGHDHSLQWFAADLSECGSKPEFVVSGAGDNLYDKPNLEPDGKRTYYENYERLGFFLAKATASSLTLVAYELEPDGTQVRQAFTRVINKSDHD